MPKLTHSSYVFFCINPSLYSTSKEISTWFTICCILLGFGTGQFLPISFGVASLALGQSYDCPSASEKTLKDMGKEITAIHFELHV